MFYYVLFKYLFFDIRYIKKSYSKLKYKRNLLLINTQILLAGAPILGTIAAGFTTGYSAIFLPQLQSNSTTIKITRDEASWIASLAAFGKNIFSSLSLFFSVLFFLLGNA
jgi:hypothetical protein